MFPVAHMHCILATNLHVAFLLIVLKIIKVEMENANTRKSKL